MPMQDMLNSDMRVEYSQSHFNKIINDLKKSDGQADQAKFKHTIQELQIGIDNLFYYRDYLDNLKNQTV